MRLAMVMDSPSLPHTEELVAFLITPRGIEDVEEKQGKGRGKGEQPEKKPADTRDENAYKFNTSIIKINISGIVMEDIETVVSAMEIVYIKRLMAKMTEIAGKLPKPRPDDPDMKAYTVIYKDLAALAEISSLRARYVRRVHVDPECKKDIEEMWQRTIKLIN